MKIVSRFPYLWPHLNFGLAEGVNEVDEAKIPLAAHAKLVHLSKPGRNAVGEEVPAPISGYEPSNKLVAAADRHARRPAVKQPVATLENLAQASAKPSKTDDVSAESKTKPDGDGAGAETKGDAPAGNNRGPNR